MSSISQLRFYFLDDTAAKSQTNYRNYRKNLIWKYWNLRPYPGSGLPGDSLSFADPQAGSGHTSNGNSYDGGSTAGRALTFLSGRYEDFTLSALSSLPTLKDYIVDTTDPLVVGHPLWQYTWFAIENYGPNALVRLQLQQDISPATNYGNSNYLDGFQYHYSKFIGLLPNVGNLTSYTTLGDSPTFGETFPHLVTYNDLDGDVKRRILWNACGRNSAYSNNATTSYRKVYHGHNNSGVFTIPQGLFYPNQVVGWAYQFDTLRNQSSGFVFPNRNYQCFDLPANHTLLGVIVTTRDVAISQNGNSALSFSSPVSTKGWKVANVEIKYNYLIVG